VLQFGDRKTSLNSVSSRIECYTRSEASIPLLHNTTVSLFKASTTCLSESLARRNVAGAMNWLVLVAALGKNNNIETTVIHGGDLHLWAY